MSDSNSDLDLDLDSDLDLDLDLDSDSVAVIWNEHRVQTYAGKMNEGMWYGAFC